MPRPPPQACASCARTAAQQMPLTDEEILAAQKELAQREGIFAAPEEAAWLAALKTLLVKG